MINEAIKEDCPLLLPAAVGLIRAINKCLITRTDSRSPEEIKFPPGGLLYRGASLPQEHIAFFAKGTQFRYPRCPHYYFQVGKGSASHQLGPWWGEKTDLVG